jgi:hypothetical protein
VIEGVIYFKWVVTRHLLIRIKLKNKNPKKILTTKIKNKRSFYEFRILVFGLELY